MIIKYLNHQQEKKGKKKEKNFDIREKKCTFET